MPPAQVQAEEDSLLRARRAELEILELENSNLLSRIATVFASSHFLTRELAAQAVAADVTPKLLDLDARYPAEVGGGVLCCAHANTTCCCRLACLVRLAEAPASHAHQTRPHCHSCAVCVLLHIPDVATTMVHCWAAILLCCAFDNPFCTSCCPCRFASPSC